MHNNRIQRLNRILKWMSTTLAVVLVIAMAVLFFASSPDAGSKAQLSQRVSEKNTATVVQPKSEQNTSKSVQQNSVNNVAQRDITKSPSAVEDDFNQRAVNEVIISTGDNSSLNLNLDNENEIIASDSSQQPLPLDATKTVANQSAVAATGQQSDSPEYSEERPVLGDKDIAGQVQDLRDQNISNVTIQLRLQSPGPDAPDKSLLRYTESDSAGEFIFQNLADADYRLTIAEKDEYGGISQINPCWRLRCDTCAPRQKQCNVPRPC